MYYREDGIQARHRTCFSPSRYFIRKLKDYSFTTTIFFMEAEAIKEKARQLKADIADYAETYYKLSLLKVTKKATDVGSSILAGVTMAVLGFLFVFFGALALGWWLGDVLESRALGFLCVGAFFLLLMLIILALRRSIIFLYFRNLLIRKFYD